MLRFVKFILDPRWNSPVSSLVALISILPEDILMSIQDGVNSNSSKIMNNFLEEKNYWKAAKLLQKLINGSYRLVDKHFLKFPRRKSLYGFYQYCYHFSIINLIKANLSRFYRRSLKAASLPFLHLGGLGSVGFWKGMTGKLGCACQAALQTGRSYLMWAMW